MPFNIFKQKPGYQEAGDHEKDVDANKAAGYARQSGVEQHNKRDRHAAQALNVLPQRMPLFDWEYVIH